MNKCKCKNCGKEINEVVIYKFDCEGNDYEQKIRFKQVPTNAICFDTDINWCGYDLTDEEQKEDIQCPYCKEYPFDKNIEIQVFDFVRIVCFKK